MEGRGRGCYFIVVAREDGTEKTSLTTGLKDRHEKKVIE